MRAPCITILRDSQKTLDHELDSLLFEKSTSELVAVLGGGDGAKYTLDLVINAADDRVSFATVTPTPSLAAMFNQASTSQKPYLLSELNFSVAVSDCSPGA